MNGLIMAAAIVAAGAPVPATPKPQPTGTIDRSQAITFAGVVDSLARRVMTQTVKIGVTENDLIAGAITGLYDEVGLPVPEAVKTAVRDASATFTLVELLAEARMQLGNHPKLAGSRSIFAAMNGFKNALDPLSILTSPRVTAYASVDQDFGVGIELEGAVGQAWSYYQVEYSIATGQYPPAGYIGTVPRPEDIVAPATLPWQVKRVIPGSPAQRSGVKPGDRIVRVDGVAITAENANAMFGKFAQQRAAFDPQSGLPISTDRVITFQRGNNKPFDLTLKHGSYNPEGAFGVLRLSDDKWNCMLDRQAKIGYIRLGAIEPTLHLKVEEMMADLAKSNCRGLILDLRWCPGGYIDPAAYIAGLFLKEESVIAKMKYRVPLSGNSGDMKVPFGRGQYLDFPLVVLAGQETIGGGELIAAALRDNDRCVIIGQRTVGRASISNTFDAGFAGLQFKLTTGMSFRPNGKNRHRSPDSQPTDDWGVRPDEGLEVPVTLNKSQELRRDAELHALRTADDRLALPFDDPNLDPYRLAALAYLHKKLGK